MSFPARHLDSPCTLFHVYSEFLFVSVGLVWVTFIWDCAQSDHWGFLLGFCCCSSAIEGDEAFFISTVAGGPSMCWWLWLLKVSDVIVVFIPSLLSVQLQLFLWQTKERACMGVGREALCGTNGEPQLRLWGDFVFTHGTWAYSREQCPLP